ncbi:carboxymuconolactone decarboxylase family protein [Streptomyces cinnamoneus]|uniref:Carboxymuconolactone decarboxylase family protein n=1 Tax=Streptomyces cinnamoneus TaxID=53446 RepID=A0A2G1XAL7_STRCJ|nr:carboxymuconolactone decarboxylase family protein [Streptomyces cinnamoneus]PHQ48255.1 carboxymuconolactone decarboxylase family protein [Streptomyces cinnamoneus]PPT15885.1 carboxymuconolactone decarboxylase family protein [Streptomyces cinnamoneus]
MARIPLDPPRTLLNRITAWYSKRTYGKVIDPLLALAHHPKVLMTDARFEKSVARWNKLDSGLKELAVMASASTIGCSWCMDFGYWLSHNQGMAQDKLRDVPRWRESDAYTPLERDVMEYAEAMSLTPPAVEDDLAERLRRRLGNEAFVELTAMVAVENLRSRINSALGLTSQGFKDSCDVPARPAV